MADIRPSHVRAFVDAQRVSAPLVVLRTPDQFQTRGEVFAAAREFKTPKIDGVPLVLAWDVARGLTAPVNGQAKVLAQLLKDAGFKQGATVDLTEAIMFLSGEHEVETKELDPETRRPIKILVPNTPTGTIAALHNAHRFWEQAPVAQAMANVRDEFKKQFKMLLALTPLGMNPPAEVKHDVILIDVALPDASTLRTIVEKTIKAVGMETSDEILDRTTNGVRGLSAFIAETSTAMALRKSGVSFDALLEQRIAAFEQVEGVRVHRGRETFADIVGLEGMKRSMLRMKTAKNPVRVVIIFDEFEKALAGSQGEGDSNGLKKGITGHLLTWQQNKRVRGSIAFGHPGCGKSLLGKALANELGCICLLVDVNAMMGGIVGTTEHNLRAFTDLVDALAGEGGAFIIATCNSMDVLTTEMRRRFNRGLFFFDLPTAEEREAAWTFYCVKNGLDPRQRRPFDDGWTPAEIAVCCEQAADYGISLVEAAENVVPVALSQPEVIDERRKGAHNRLLDVATGRTYRMPGTIAASSVSTHTDRAIAEMPA
jgi:hypothetical protein